MLATKEVTIVNEKEFSTTKFNFKEGSVNTVKDLLLATSINSETVIVTRGSDVLLSDDTVNDKDTITLLSVISGG